MRHIALPVGVLAFSCCAASAWAAEHIKPGLWEMAINPPPGANLPRMPPKMSPEQAQKMKDMGMNLPEIRDGKIIRKVCVTKEMAERDEPIELRRTKENCQTRNYQRNAKGYSADIICTGNPQGQGRVQGTITGNERISMVYDFKGTDSDGKPIDHHLENSMKWMAADCGSIKPYNDAVPKK